MAFADATSAGQEVCAIPAVAERETADTTLNTVARTFLICAILSHLGLLRYPAVFSPSRIWPMRAPTRPLGCSPDAMRCPDNKLHITQYLKLTSPYALSQDEGRSAPLRSATRSGKLSGEPLEGHLPLWYRVSRNGP